MGFLGFVMRRGFHRLSNFFVIDRRINAESINCMSRRTFSSGSLDDCGKDSILPILIVGAGPVGLILSILLTKLGIQCAVIEKSKVFSNHPQAHFINNRSMEVFRKLDGLAEEVLVSQPPVDFWRKFIYCTSLTGPIIGSVDHMNPQDFDRILSPVSVAHFSQHKLMSLLLPRLEKLGFYIRSCEGIEKADCRPVKEREILLGHECTSIKAAADGVIATASLFREGKYVEKDIHCRFVIGTDGAGSTVRQLMGIQMRGENDLQKLISVHFMSRDLGRYLMHERPGMLFFIFNSAAIGVLVAHDLKHGEFVLQIPFYPPQQKLEDFSTKMCERIILKLVGRELADIAVLDVKPWVMHAEVAERYLSCENRVILAGDAAHRFPPAGGFGMNTGIQDAHNLAWKLASVITGISPVSLLSSYEMERRPIAIFNTELSVQNFKAAMAVPSALGLNPTIANAVHQTLNDGLGSIFPSELQRAVLDGILTLGRAQVSDIVLNESNPLGASRLARVRKIFEEGRSLQLQFPAEDLGFRYLKGAVVNDEDERIDEPEAPTGRRREYIPSAEPGSRLPHMNICLLSKPSRKEIFSTLDLVPVDKMEFVFIIAPHRESYKLARAASKVAETFGVMLKVSVIWPESSDALSRTGAEMEPSTNFVDIVEVKQSKNSLSWWELCQLTDQGAILVRPDEHIAWRTKSGVVSDPITKMKKVFSTVVEAETNM